MSAPLVSVAIATCDGAAHLDAQLATVYAQTWPALEVVASDDASTDGTVAVLERWARERGLRYRVNRERLGLVGNFARAIEMCRGDYVALCDQDDLWKAHKVERLMAEIGGWTLVYGNVQEYVEGDGEPRIETAFEPIVEFARAHGTGRPTRYLLAESWVVSHSLMFRRELADHALPIPPHQPYHDGWLALVASTLGGIRFLDERLQTYRRHSASLTWNGGPGRRAFETAVEAVLSGRFAERFRARCRAEVARIEDALALPTLDAGERAFAEELLAYWRTGLAPGGRWRSFAAGLAVAPYFSTQRGLAGRLKVPLRGLVGGL